jgi:hypothetical protein
METLVVFDTVEKDSPLLDIAEHIVRRHFESSLRFERRSLRLESTSLTGLFAKVAETSIQLSVMARVSRCFVTSAFNLSHQGEIARVGVLAGAYAGSVSLTALNLRQKNSLSREVEERVFSSIPEALEELGPCAKNNKKIREELAEFTSCFGQAISLYTAEPVSRVRN